MVAGCIPEKEQQERQEQEKDQEMNRLKSEKVDPGN